MSTSFDTTAWVIQTLLIMLALLAAIPLLRAVAGLALIAGSTGLSRGQQRVRDFGIAILPGFLRTALGFAAAVAVAHPAMASAAEVPVLDRVVATVVTTTPVEVIVSEPAPISAAQTTAPAVTPLPDTRSDSEDSDDTYTVRHGDSLWSIARDHLRSGDGTAREIDRAWRAIWELNRDVIGSDPSHIEPGQLLSIPHVDAVAR